MPLAVNESQKMFEVCLALLEHDPVPAGTDVKAYPRLRIIFSRSGALLDEQYVTTSPTLSGFTVFPSSGAIPGPAKCPSGYYPYDNGSACTEDGNIVRGNGHTSFVITGPHGGRANGKFPVFLDEPIAALPAGTVLACQAFLGADWTYQAPSAAGSAQHIPG